MAGLTATERMESVELIREINQRGVSIVMIEHNMDVVMSVSNRVLVLDAGKMLALGFAGGGHLQRSRDQRLSGRREEECLRC